MRNHTEVCGAPKKSGDVLAKAFPRQIKPVMASFAKPPASFHLNHFALTSASFHRDRSAPTLASPFKRARLVAIQNSLGVTAVFVEYEEETLSSSDFLEILRRVSQSPFLDFYRGARRDCWLHWLTA